MVLVLPPDLKDKQGSPIETLRPYDQDGAFCPNGLVAKRPSRSCKSNKNLHTICTRRCRSEYGRCCKFVWFLQRPMELSSCNGIGLCGFCAKSVRKVLYFCKSL